MWRTKVASGLKLKNNFEFSNCEICITQKLTSLPFSSRARRSQHRLEIIYSDFCGPMRTSSIGGARYFMTLIDDHSRQCQVYFLKSKDEATSKFVEFKKFIENQTGFKVKAFYSDNEREFCNTIMDRVLRESGIQRRLFRTHPSRTGSPSGRIELWSKRHVACQHNPDIFGQKPLTRQTTYEIAASPSVWTDSL